MEFFRNVLEGYMHTVATTNNYFQQVQAVNPNYLLDAPSIAPLTVTTEE